MISVNEYTLSPEAKQLKYSPITQLKKGNKRIICFLESKILSIY